MSTLSPEQQAAASAAPPLGPGDLTGLFNVLSAALSTETGTRKEAEDTLAAMEWRQGFCSCLLEILGNKSADQSARWLASTQLKNTIVRQWRPRRTTGIKPQEKAHLRGKLLETISEENNQIAVQIALSFAKVARHDFPREWPSLFQDLLARQDGGDLLLQRRVYLVLHHVLKELSSKRLTADQKNFAEITKQLLDHVWTNWCSDTRVLISGLPAAISGPSDAKAEKPLLLHFERWLMLLKALRRLLLFGFPSDEKTAQPCQEIMQVLPALLQALQTLLPFRPASHPLNKPLAMLDRGLLKLIKTLTDVRDMHPWAFYTAEVLLPVSNLACETLLNQRLGVQDAFRIRCMHFLKNVVMCNAYKASESNLNAFTPAAQKAARSMATQVKPVLAEFWQRDDRMCVMAIALIKLYLPLTASELREWHDNPEGFVADNSSGSWEDQLRGIAETLLLAFLEVNREPLAPAIMDALKAADEACPAGAVESLVAAGGEAVCGVPRDVLLKEAVYNAVGVGSHELFDYIQFADWFSGTLVKEAADRCPAAKPLRRRAVLLIGSWVNKLGGHWPTAYQVVEAALGDEDVVLKLAAIDTLRAMVDDWDFKEDAFLQHIPGCMQHLVTFLGQADENDTQLKVFSLITLIIERVGQSMRPYIPGMLSLLPQVWHQSDGNALLRIQVMFALQEIVNILGNDSTGAYDVLLPVLGIATDMTQPDEVNLLEDGLALWLIALRNAPQSHPSLLQLYPNLHQVMARSTEHIRVACQITISAILLGGQSFLAQYGSAVVAILTDTIGAVNERGMLYLLPVLETIITCFPQEAPTYLEGALTKLLALTLGGGESTSVVAASTGVFARMLLNNPSDWPSYFQRYAAHMSPPAGTPSAASPGEAVMFAFIDTWLGQLDCVAQPAARKLSGLALCRLLRIPHVGVLERLEGIVAAITGLWHEMEGGADDGTRIVYRYDYYTVISGGGMVDESQGAVKSEDADGETARRKMLHDADPVNALKLSSEFQACFQECAGVHGDNFRTAAQSMDQSIASQMQLVLGAASKPA